MRLQLCVAEVLHEALHRRRPLRSTEYVRTDVGVAIENDHLGGVIDGIADVLTVDGVADGRLSAGDVEVSGRAYLPSLNRKSWKSLSRFLKKSSMVVSPRVGLV